MATLTDGELRWAVVLVDLDLTLGHEQAGTRRALVVSYESFHRSGMATICPITTRQAKYPGEVSLPVGHAGQTRDGLILCHQVRTLDLARVSAYEFGGRVQYVTERGVRSAVRSALAHQLGLELHAVIDGAEAD